MLVHVQRPAARGDRDLCSGPARLAQAFGLNRDADGASLMRGSLGIYDDDVAPPRRPGRSVRVGLAPGKGDTSRWRWFVTGNEHVSKAR